MTRAELPRAPAAKETLLEFGSRLDAAVPPETAAVSDAAPDAVVEALKRDTPTRCPRCGQHFSPDGRFCPFDAEPLVPATDWDPRGDPLLEQVVDQRYLVEAVIGEGGMGRVYRVRHVSLGKRFALKALRQDLASDTEIAARFIHEARTAASVAHPGLVQISDFGHLPSGQAYFVMELLEGLPLSALLRRYGALPAARAVKLALKVAEALAVAHEAGVVHRDLKPDNIHVRPLEDHDEVKIVDFGLAKVVGTSRLTRDGVVFGTPYYMSPEQASGEPTDHRADIYALGVVLYEMLTGRVPFEADTYMGVLTKHIYMKPAPPSEILGIPGELGALETVVMRCLEKKPERRFAKLADLHAALLQIPEEPMRRLDAAPKPLDAPLLTEEFDTTAFAAIPRPGPPTWVLGGGLLLGSAALGAVLVGALATRGSSPASGAESGAAPSPSVTLARHGDATQREAAPHAPPPSALLASGAPTTSAAPQERARSADAAGKIEAPPVKSAPPRRAAPPKPRPQAFPSSRDIIDPWAK